MSVLIYGVGALVTLAIFLALSALPAIIAYRIGRRFRASSVRWVLPALVVGVPVGWAWAGYATFKASCSTVPVQEFIAPPARAPEALFSVSRHLDGEYLIERGFFRMVEQPQGAQKIRRDFAGQRPYPGTPVPVKTEWLPATESKSEHVVTESMERESDRWWRPPLYINALEVRELKTGRLVAKATDLVFGGGLLGTYMRLLGGDQDFRYVSCGYASPDVGAWRPSLASRPRFSQYREADVAFITRALNVPR